jgi:lipopolysaccharide transport system permease protein
MSKAFGRAGLPQRRWIHLRDLLRELVVRDLKLRYERSLLGVLWAVLNPLAQLLVFVVVFQHVLKLDIPNYPLFVFIGIVIWNWTREGLVRCASAVTANRDLVRQPGFPLHLLPVVALATPLFDLLVALPLIILFVLFGGGEPTFALLLLPAVIALHFLLLQGLGYLLAVAQVTYRDTGHLLGVVLMLGFYLTPVFYDIGALPSGVRPVYLFNPIAHLLGAYRDILMQGRLPELPAFIVLAVVGAVLCSLGRAVFIRASDRFVEEL